MPKETRSSVIRDAFTMPESDYSLIKEIKTRAIARGVDTNKSEIIRAGLRALDGMTDAALARALKGIERVKTGRPKGSKINK